MKSKIIKATAGVTSFLMSTSQVMAQTNVGISGDDFPITNLGSLVTAIGRAAIVIAAILVFLYLIWGGIQWITSGGDKGKTEEARGRITAALVGLTIVAAAWAIMMLVTNFLGIEDPENLTIQPVATSRSSQ